MNKEITKEEIEVIQMIKEENKRSREAFNSTMKDWLCAQMVQEALNTPRKNWLKRHDKA